jgi:hypothetical protein
MSELAATVSRPPRQIDSDPSWRLSERIGLGLCWLLGLAFCAVALAIVGFMLVQGLRFLRPSLLFSHPAAGVGQTHTGGFLDPMVGTLAVSLIGIAIVRARARGRIDRRDDRGHAVDRARAVRHADLLEPGARLP